MSGDIIEEERICPNIGHMYDSLTQSMVECIYCVKAKEKEETKEGESVKDPVLLRSDLKVMAKHLVECPHCPASELDNADIQKYAAMPSCASLPRRTKFNDPEAKEHLPAKRQRNQKQTTDYDDLSDACEDARSAHLRRKEASLDLQESQMNSIRGARSFLTSFKKNMSNIPRFFTSSELNPIVGPLAADGECANTVEGEITPKPISEDETVTFVESPQFPSTKTIFVLICHEGIKQPHVWQTFFEMSRFGFVVYCSKKYQHTLTLFFRPFLIPEDVTAYNAYGDVIPAIMVLFCRAVLMYPNMTHACNT
jgi:hypothetical protein